jgi:hypothetical protein
MILFIYMFPIVKSFYFLKQIQQNKLIIKIFQPTGGKGVSAVSTAG